MAANGQRSLEKRERILDAAVRVFASHGYYNAKISQVAEMAEVADGTIYIYFKNKDDLLISVFENRMEMLSQRLIEELKAQEGALAKLRRCIELHLRLALDYPDLAEFISVELRQSSKFIKDYKNEKFINYLHILEEALREGQQEGVIRPDLHVEVTTRALFGALDEQLLTLVLSRRIPSARPLTEREVIARAEALFSIFVEGMRPRPEAHPSVSSSA
jgi:TetR/AcrR family fatty acid metabolism transcriptional regulator